MTQVQYTPIDTDEKPDAPPEDPSNVVNEKRQTTEYVVLKKAGGSSTWAEHKRVEAGSAKAAVNAVVKDAGEYIAVPARSWHPMTVKIETKTELKIS